MKRTIFILGFLSIFLLTQQLCLAEDLNIGYISLSKIFSEYKKVTDSNKKLDEQKKQVKGMLDGLKELEKNFDQLNDKGKEERKNQILSRQDEIRKLSLEIRKDEDRILREILQDIEKAAGDIRQKQKITLILDDRLVISGPKEMDITNKVVEILNERYKGK